MKKCVYMTNFAVKDILYFVYVRLVHVLDYFKTIVNTFLALNLSYTSVMTWHLV